MSKSVPGKSPPSGLSFPVVGLGASAGGLEALIRCFEHLPGAPDMAFVVILHLSPKHESNAAEILQRATPMPVRQVNGAMRIESNHVYVIPPTHDLLMFDGHLSLTEPGRDKGRHSRSDPATTTLTCTQACARSCRRPGE